MGANNATWPVAFILAMGAQAADGKPPIVENASAPLTPGALAEMAQQGVRGETTPTDRGALRRAIFGEKLVQFFPNFRNCFTGTWRNC